MQTTLYKAVEFFLLFVLLPISFAIEYPVWIKLTIGLLGFIYIIWILLKVLKLKFRLQPALDWKAFWRRTLLILGTVAVLSVLYVYFTDRSMLFYVPMNNPKLYIIIFLIYSVLSVYPQELVYRTFFFERYGSLFNSSSLLVIINAALFSLAHIFFRNALVMLLTFMGGLLFAFTFIKTRSTILVSIEHIIYGIWLYTVGMGEMLAFPKGD